MLGEQVRILSKGFIDVTAIFLTMLSNPVLGADDIYFACPVLVLYATDSKSWLIEDGNAQWVKNFG